MISAEVDGEKIENVHVGGFVYLRYLLTWKNVSDKDLRRDSRVV